MLGKEGPRRQWISAVWLPDLKHVSNSRDSATDLELADRERLGPGRSIREKRFDISCKYKVNVGSLFWSNFFECLRQPKPI